MSPVTRPVARGRETVQLLVAESASTQRLRDALEPGHGAEEMLAEVAEVADLAERYAVCDLQWRILREQLEIHARQHTSPLLNDAGRVLLRAALGFHGTLRVAA